MVNPLYRPESPDESWSNGPEPSRWPALQPAAFYGLAGQVVATLEPHTESDPVALLVSFLVAAGAAIGAGPHAVADGAAHPARLFAILIGDT